MRPAISFTLCIIAMLLLLDTAHAQEDIPSPPLSESGDYRMRVDVGTGTSEDAVFEACCVRVDQMAPVDLGCGPREDGDVEGEEEHIIQFDVTMVKTPGNDAEVRCFSMNIEEASDLSVNAYIMTFPTKPSAPTVR